MSKTRCLLHIVFATKRRRKTIHESHKRDLYAYIYGLVINRKCHVHRINGVANHIHMLIDLHPTVAFADLVKDIKQFSSSWLHKNPDFPDFDSWGEGYYAVSLGVDNLDACKRYIINQEAHHNHKSLEDEVVELAKLNGLEWHPDDLS